MMRKNVDDHDLFYMVAKCNPKAMSLPVGQ